MKYIYTVILIIVFAGCDSENALDCFQVDGKIVQQTIDVHQFTRVTVFSRVQLFIEQSDTYEVLLETGENLVPEINFTVIDGELRITNENTCNLLRDHNATKVYIKAPNLTEIRNSSNFVVKSKGILHFERLTLIAEDTDSEATNSNGDFNININVNRLEVVTNGRARFTLSGTATNANYGMFSGHTFIDAQNVLSDHVSFFQRSSDNLIINPRLSLTGEIVSIGNVISKNKPPKVDVEELFEGRLIFE